MRPTFGWEDASIAAGRATRSVHVTTMEARMRSSAGSTLRSTGKSVSRKTNGWSLCDAR